MKARLRVFAWIHIVIFIGFLFPAVPVSGAEFPRAQLDESERYFIQGYMRFLNREYWDTLDYLDRALKANTYLVDYYLLKGLAMNRIGDLRTGREALAYYLEVRPLDAATPRIFSYMIDIQRELGKILSPVALSTRWRISRPDLQSEFALGPLRSFSVRGLGKAEAFNASLYLADTLGDCVYVHEKKRADAIPLKSPAAVMPMGDGSFYVAGTGGEIYSCGAADPTSPDLRGTIGYTITDAAALSANAFVVADPVARKTVFCSFQDFSTLDEWAPPDQEMLFEPVALAVYGPWLAVADRGNGRIFFLDAAGGRDFFSVDISRPRDVFWSPVGELFVITENGDLYRVSVNFRDRRTESADLLESGISEGWTLFGSAAGDVYCLDISGSKLRKAVSVPDVSTSSGFLSISLPMIEREENRESFVLSASLMSPFVTYSRVSDPVVYAVWNNKMISSLAVWKEEKERKPGVFMFHRPAPPGTVSPELKNMVAENGTDVQIALPPLWGVQKDVLTNLVVDSSIIFSREELEVMALFCLNNGIELDVWARTMPSVEMVRASALTGGKVFFSAAGVPNLNPPHNRLQIRIPLPQELSSSGYPGRSMLTVYLDIGLMQTKDWIPLWPDLLEQ